MEKKRFGVERGRSRLRRICEESKASLIDGKHSFTALGLESCLCSLLFVADALYNDRHP